MKSFIIAIANLKQVFRDLKSNGIVFALPIVFIAVFGIVFNQSFSDVTFSVGIVPFENEEYTVFIDRISSAQNKEGEALFNISLYDNKNDAMQAVQSRDINVAITPHPDGKIALINDTSDTLSRSAASVIRDFSNPNFDLFVTQDVLITENYTEFEKMASGLIVYGLLIMIPQVAGALAILKDKKYIFRYFTSQASSFDIIAGFTLSQLIIGMIQVGILFISSFVFGFEPVGNILVGFIFSIPVTLFVVGIGLLIGSFASKGEAGQNLGTMLSIVLGFLSGSFFPGIENLTLSIGNQTFAIVDFIPTYYATDGMRDVLLFNASLTDILPQITVISLSAFVMLLLGVFTYQQRQLRNVS